VTKRIVFPREVLLVEVERRCRDAVCGARTRLPLTKGEARAYTGFECSRCGLRFPDSLTERDIPEWWEELSVASLEGLRPPREVGGVGGGDAEVVARMSEAWRHLGVERGAAPEDAEGERGDSF
jgi:alkylation response protein AidB-like acyl-CoA dehydrogenase